MAEQPRPDDLAQLRATVMTLQHDLARLQRRRRLPRRFLPLALVGLLVTLLPLSILAAGPTFSDLGTAAPVHQPNIQAIGDAGITTGFEDPNSPGQRLYDPKANVTREEMASFLARTAGLGGNAPVVNAATVGGRVPASLGRLGAAPAPAAITLDAQDREIATVDLDVPAPGYVLVIATHQLTTVNGKPGAGDLVASFQCNYFGASRVSPPFAAALEDSVGHASGTLTHVFPMDAALVGPHRFALRARLAPGSAPLVATASLTALYVPFGPDGAIP
jgi:hypothetical protein